MKHAAWPTLKSYTCIWIVSLQTDMTEVLPSFNKQKNKEQGKNKTGGGGTTVSNQKALVFYEQDLFGGRVPQKFQFCELPPLIFKLHNPNTGLPPKLGLTLRSGDHTAPIQKVPTPKRLLCDFKGVNKQHVGGP